MSRLIFFISLLLLLNFYNLASAEHIAELRTIDRVTGRTFKLLAPLDTNIKFANLLINIKVCIKSPPEKQPESSAYLVIKEIGIDKVIYEGWMFASSPSLRSLEHPVYDVWLLRCKKNIN